VFFVDPDETFHFYSGQDPAVWFNSYGNRIMVIFFVQGTPLTRLCITTYTVGPKCRRPAGIEQCYPAVSVCFVFIFFCIRVTKTCHIHLSLWLCCGSESGSVSFFACYVQIRIHPKMSWIRKSEKLIVCEFFLINDVAADSGFVSVADS
jgi:hypothetical protein